MRFRDIISCQRLTEGEELELSMKVKHEFKVPFYLKTNQREMLVFTKDNDECSMWIDAFNYILCCGKKLKKIIC